MVRAVNKPDPAPDSTTDALRVDLTLRDIPSGTPTVSPAGSTQAAELVARIRRGDSITAEEIAALHLQNVAEAHNLLRVSKATVRNMVTRRDLDGFRVGGQFLIPLASITGYLADNYTAEDDIPGASTAA
ncbi:hypothetical protein Ppa06_57610 [Planomonospora parontospora subsp. parontospora]|uniref:Helix-turn-helix domain-containing protein n=2 Tax=Planomonospora parontospora TaxID=58119 RepID=A0AA37BM21_9ACTN|nr:helix-turn-helix domain-containing protein [Planomonospora parontospora]GGK90721.1 hypothetical protein GCM10010126_57700 [Planomonospora parontospora]GII11963.1 hypothetical protein Ppa06_57610 [Planomonospora parontospora subsp. parontospora]